MRVFILPLSLLLLTSSVNAQVAGTVVDDVTDEPISEAVVSVQASDIETSTDPTGAFSLADATGQGLTIVAGSKGYFYSSAIVTSPESNLELRLEPVPQVDDPRYTFQPPEKCRSCHEEQYQEWKGSPMSKAGLNTWVYDIYNGGSGGCSVSAPQSSPTGLLWLLSLAFIALGAIGRSRRQSWLRHPRTRR